MAAAGTVTAGRNQRLMAAASDTVIRCSKISADDSAKSNGAKEKNGKIRNCHTMSSGFFRNADIIIEEDE